MAEIRTDSNCTDSFASNKNNVLIAMGSTSAVSLIMCLVAVSLVLWLKVYNIFTYRLALYQVLSSFSLTLALVLSLMLIDYDEESLYYKVACKTDAFLLQYTATVKLLFTICLNFHIFSLAVCLKNFRKLELCYIFFSCFTPLMTSWIPFIGDFYGLAGAWCWIKTWKHNCASHHYTQGILEQFLLWYGPLFLSLTASVISVFVVILVLLHQSYGYCRKSVPEREQLLEKEERKKMRNALRDLLPLLAYPLLFYVLTLLPLVNRIYSSISPHHVPATGGHLLTL